MEDINARIREVAERFVEDAIRYMLSQGYSDRDIKEILAPVVEKFVNA